MEVIVALIVGIIVGIICTYFKMKKINQRPPIVGKLKCERSDPDGPYLFLELNTRLDDVIWYKEVTLEVNQNGYLPHK